MKLCVYHNYSELWKDLTLATMEEWMEMKMELAEMTKLTALIRDRALTRFYNDWKSLIDFQYETEKDEFKMHGFDNQSKNNILWKM